MVNFIVENLLIEAIGSLCECARNVIFLINNVGNCSRQLIYNSPVAACFIHQPPDESRAGYTA